MSYTKYTKELLEPLVKKSTSVAQVIRKLGLKEAGGTHALLSRKIKKFEIDSSHFLGQASNCGKGHKGGPKKKTWQETLVKRKNGKRQYSFRLRRALIESGREYKCEMCDCLPEWNGKELRLQVDHKNSDWLDDRKRNLRFLCPNCHSQTEGFCGSKGFSEVTSIAKGERERRKSKKQKKQKQPKSKKQTDPNWRTNSKPHLRKVERPNLESLLKEVQEQNYSAVGRKYGVSDNCIRKWIRFEKKKINELEK